MTVTEWTFGRLRILVLADSDASAAEAARARASGHPSRTQPRGGVLPPPGSMCGLRGLEGLRQALPEVLLEGCRAVILDLGKMEYINALDFVEIIGCYKLARERGCELALLRPSPNMRTLVEAIRANRVLQVFDDEATALALLGG